MFLRIFSRRRDEEKKTVFRNLIFGVEDSLVSTVGLLSGVAAADSDRSAIVTTGVVLIFVEAFSMGIGSFLSEETAGQMTNRVPARTEIGKGAAVMFVSYLFAGLVPLLPYSFLAKNQAVPVSILLTLTSLVALGIFSARKFKGNLFSKGVEMLILGGLATLVGIAVGSLFRL